MSKLRLYSKWLDTAKAGGKKFLKHLQNVSTKRHTKHWLYTVLCCRFNATQRLSLVYKKCGSKETEVSEVEKHLLKKNKSKCKHENPHFLYTMLSAAFLLVELLNYKQ